MTGEDGATFDTPGNLAAAETLRRWVDTGYFNDGYDGVGYDDAWQQFAAGDGVFFLSGTWLNGQLQETMGDNVGFFLMPGVESDQALSAAGGLADPWHISANTDHPEEAKMWLAFLTGERAAELLAENSSLPAIVPDNVTFPAGSLGALSIEAWDALQSSEDGGVVPFFDMPTPSMGDTVFAALQELMAGQIEPDDFIQTVQQDWDAFNT